MAKFIVFPVSMSYLTRKGYFAKEMSISMSGQRLRELDKLNVL